MTQQSLTSTPNPLSMYFRQPKLYIKLPSKGNFYPPTALEKTESGDYAVYAMTAIDELMFKTPDALMNGQSTVSVIKSCVPAIKDPWKMPTVDLDAILLAIRVATYGEGMEIRQSCPKCNHLNEFNLNLIGYLDKLNAFEFNSVIQHDPLTINIRPYTYKEMTDTQIRTLEEQKILTIVNDKEMSDDEKVQLFGQSLDKLTVFTVDVIAKCISSIVTPDTTVTDPAMITEFIKNSPSEVFNKISKHVNTMQELLSLKATDLQCEECKHVWSSEISMDQTNFFGKGS